MQRTTTVTSRTTAAARVLEERLRMSLERWLEWCDEQRFRTDWVAKRKGVRRTDWVAEWEAAVKGDYGGRILDLKAKALILVC